MIITWTDIAVTSIKRFHELKLNNMESTKIINNAIVGLKRWVEFKCTIWL